MFLRILLIILIGMFQFFRIKKRINHQSTGDLDSCMNFPLRGLVSPSNLKTSLKRYQRQSQDQRQQTRMSQSSQYSHTNADVVDFKSMAVDPLINLNLQQDVKSRIPISSIDKPQTLSTFIHSRNKPPDLGLSSELGHHHEPLSSRRSPKLRVGRG